MPTGGCNTTTTLREVKIGDWVKPIGHRLPGPGAWFGRVLSIGTYSTLNIPGYMVDTSYGEAKPQLVDAEAVEYWFTPEKEAQP